MHLPRSRINGCFSEPPWWGRENRDAGARLLLVKASGAQTPLTAAAALPRAAPGRKPACLADVTAAVRAGGPARVTTQQQHADSERLRPGR